MCRLYGFHANEETKVECSLVYAQNALLSQSRADLRGTAHPDGWGIAVYENTAPLVEKRLGAAFEDLHFSLTAERVFAKTVIAHVRLATVGQSSVRNTHPFTHGVWTFVHNGTVRAFDVVGPALEAELPPSLRRCRLGSTDSELAFLWLLGRLADAGIPIDSVPGDGECGSDLATAVDVLRRAVTTLDRRCVAAGADKPARLNFLLTDGRWLLASRWRNSLFLLERPGVHDCEICGIPHVHHLEDTDYRAMIVASEPITHETWREVPEGMVVAVDSALDATMHAI